MRSFAVKLLLVGIAGFLVFRAISSGYTSSDETEDTGSVTQIEPGVKSDPVEVEKTKTEVDAAVRLFVKTYYSRDGRLFSGGIDVADRRFAAMLEPLVTEKFLSTYVASLDIPQNSAFTKGVYSQKARVSKMSFHGDVDDTEAERLATVAITSLERDQPLDKRKFEVEFLLEKVDGAWRVSGCTCDT